MTMFVEERTVRTSGNWSREEAAVCTNGTGARHQPCHARKTGPQGVSARFTSQHGTG
jgi:hypothetical protein